MVGADLARMGLRYSFSWPWPSRGNVTALEKIVVSGKFYGQEILFLLLIGWTFLSTISA